MSKCTWLHSNKLFTKIGRESTTVCKPHPEEKFACSSAGSRGARTELASRSTWERVESLMSRQGLGGWGGGVAAAEPCETWDFSTRMKEKEDRDPRINPWGTPMGSEGKEVQGKKCGQGDKQRVWMEETASTSEGREKQKGSSRGSPEGPCLGRGRQGSWGGATAVLGQLPGES